MGKNEFLGAQRSDGVTRYLSISLLMSSGVVVTIRMFFLLDDGKRCVGVRVRIRTGHN